MQEQKHTGCGNYCWGTGIQGHGQCRAWALYTMLTPSTWTKHTDAEEPGNAELGPIVVSSVVKAETLVCFFFLIKQRNDMIGFTKARQK